MRATTAKVGSHAMRRMVKRESERTIYQLAFIVPIIAAFLRLEAFDLEAPGPLSPATVGQQTTTVSGSRPAEGNFELAPTKVDNVRPRLAREGMVWISGGEFSMGSKDTREMVCGGSDAMSDARPIHRVHVDSFWMDEVEVTNEEFEKFVEATRYATWWARAARAK